MAVTENKDGHSTEPSAGEVLCNMLDRTTFAHRLEAAMSELFDLTGKFCHNTLSPNLRFIQEFRVPKLRNPHAGMDAIDKEVLESRILREHDLLEEGELLTLLHREGRVPGYINATVLRALPEVTVIGLFISRRLRADAELFHGIDKNPPFHVLVSIPPSIDVNAFDGEKWDVNWEWDRRRHEFRPLPREGTQLL